VLPKSGSVWFGADFPEPRTKGVPKKKKDLGLFFFEVSSGHRLTKYVSRRLSIYGNSILTPKSSHLAVLYGASS
jgi:hypothetical protein